MEGTTVLVTDVVWIRRVERSFVVADRSSNKVGKKKSELGPLEAVPHPAEGGPLALKGG